MKITPLNALHRELGAQLVEFAGYEMPVRYPPGILEEHLHTRRAAGLFDVSHMGQICIRGTDALKKLEALTPTDLASLPLHHNKYTVLLNEAGGILDDMIVTNMGDYADVVVNGAVKDQDLAYLKAHLGDGVESCFDSHGLLALQGPKAADVLARYTDVSDLYFMQGKKGEINGIACWISRSGYTGEDGFELACPRDQVEKLARTLLQNDAVKMIGLGARDSLRLEAGLCLYGHDMTADQTPVEAGLNFIISKPRRERKDFPGAAKILSQIESGPQQVRVGLEPEGRAPVREGVELYSNGEKIGVVTSGTFSPTLEKPIAMGYVRYDLRSPGTPVTALLRGREVPCRVVKTPFIEPRYRRAA